MRNLNQLIGAAAIAIVTTTTPVHAEEIVNVTLIDKTSADDFGKTVELGMGMKGDIKMAKMGIAANPKMVSRGKVRFNVTNLASTLVHEAIIAPINDEAGILAYDKSKNRVDEDTLLTLGQVGEIYPGKSASFTIDLQPGTYILYCNIDGHYMAGMWTVIEVQ